MTDQAPSARSVLPLVRRHKIVVGGLVMLGLLAGVGYGLSEPPRLTSTTLIVVPGSGRDMPTQVVIAGSTPVLATAAGEAHVTEPLPVFQRQVRAKSLTANVLSISVQAATASQAEDAANAVASSYVAFYAATTKGAAAQILAPATQATGTSLLTYLLLLGLAGALAGALIGTLVAVLVSRGDRRLRHRDDIADAIGVPVMASIKVSHPSDPGDWTKLLQGYRPSAVEAWQLRGALHQLGQADLGEATPSSVGVLSLSDDREGLVIGPQLAVFAARLGIPTTLVIGAEQGADVSGALRTACAALAGQASRLENLSVCVRDQDGSTEPADVGLTVVVVVVEPESPDAVRGLRTPATLLAVSSGSATAEQLARVAASAFGARCPIVGIVVANPDPADRTTGRLPQLIRPAPRMPTRLLGTTTAGTRP
jgi:hypothetical protein